MYIKNNLIAKYLQACMVCLKEERTPFTVIEVVIHMNNNNIYKFIVFFFSFRQKKRKFIETRNRNTARMFTKQHLLKNRADLVQTMREAPTSIAQEQSKELEA